MPEDPQLVKDVAQIRKDVDSILHGNGRKGLWAISDTVFGPPDKSARGLVEQVKTLSEAREAELNQRIGSQKTLRQIRAGVLLIIALLGAGGTAVTMRLFELLGAS